MKLKESALVLSTGILFTTLFLKSNLFMPAVNITPTVGTNDFTDSYVPIQSFFAESVRKGTVPLWSSVFSGGYPFYTRTLGFFYPTNLVAVFLPLAAAVSVNLFLNYFLIYVLTCFYLRKIQVKTVPSVFGAVVFTFSGFSGASLIYPDILTTLHLLVAEVLILEYLLGSKHEFRYILLLGLVLGLAILAGHPQIAFYGQLFIFSYWLVFWVIYKKSFSKFILYALITVTVAVSIGAGTLLPTAEFTQYSTRASGLASPSISRFKLAFADLVTFISPFATYEQGNTYEAFIKNGWPRDDMYLYPGLIGLAFSLWGLVKLRSWRPYGYIFAASALVALFMSFGDQLTVTGFILNRPPLSFFRLPFKFLFIMNFSLAVLAAFAFQELLKYRFWQEHRVWALLLAAILIGTELADVASQAKRLHPEVNARNWYKEPESVTFVKNKLKDRERVTVQQYFYPSVKIFLERSEQWKDFNTFINLRNLLPAFNNLMYNIPLNVNAANSAGLKIARYNELDQEIYFGGIKYSKDLAKGEVIDASMFLNRLMGVRFLISATPLTHFNISQVKKFEFAGGQEPIYVYELVDYYPRTFMVPKAEKAFPADIKTHLFKGDFNPKDKVFIEEDTDWGAKGGFAASALFEKYTDNEIIIKTQSAGDGFLFLSDTFYPGWKAYVDGKATKIYRANYAFRAVPVVEGAHVITFIYEPQSFWWGLKITVAAVLLVILLLCTNLISVLWFRLTTRKRT